MGGIRVRVGREGGINSQVHSQAGFRIRIRIRVDPGFFHLLDPDPDPGFFPGSGSGSMGGKND